VIADPSNLGNFMIADTRRTSRNTQVNRYTAAPGVSSREPASTVPCHLI